MLALDDPPARLGPAAPPAVRSPATALSTAQAVDGGVSEVVNGTANASCAGSCGFCVGCVDGRGASAPVFRRPRLSRPVPVPDPGSRVERWCCCCARTRACSPQRPRHRTRPLAPFTALDHSSPSSDPTPPPRRAPAPRAAPVHLLGVRWAVQQTPFLGYLDGPTLSFRGSMLNELKRGRLSEECPRLPHSWSQYGKSVHGGQGGSLVPPHTR